MNMQIKDIYDHLSIRHSTVKDDRGGQQTMLRKREECLSGED